MEARTVNVVLGVRVCRLVVVHHLHDLQEVVLVEFLKPVGQLVHVDLGHVSLSFSVIPKGNRIHTFLSVRFFFFALSSPVAPRLGLTPFSSPGTGPVSRNAARKAGLGFLNV